MTEPKKKGGAQPGAGRPKGVKNKRTLEMQEAIAAAGVTPLEYMLKVMRNPKADPERRDRMAAAAAPYVHSKLATIEVGGKDGKPIEFTQITRRIVKA